MIEMGQDHFGRLEIDAFGWHHIELAVARFEGPLAELREKAERVDEVDHAVLEQHRTRQRVETPVVVGPGRLPHDHRPAINLLDRREAVGEVTERLDLHAAAVEGRELRQDVSRD